MSAEIVRAAIHPGIGVARVGSSPTEHLLAPQVPFPAPRPHDSSHDSEGQLKREAAQFRIYGYDADGRVVAELTAENAEIEWTVHVVNRKAAWFKFRHAMDIPSLADTVVERRNPTIVDPGQRRGLVIDPGARTIRGIDQAELPQYRFDSGTFMGVPVYLGELRTDGAGRLLFLPGFGVSSSPIGTEPYVDTDQDAFGNAAGWQDDVADGPIDARVRIDGREIATDGAWVVSAPPNYAPDIKSWRSLYDVVRELYVAAGWLQAPATTSFTHDIYPILERLSGLQWTNKAFAAVFGHGAPFDFRDPALLAKLSRVHDGSADIYRPLRTAIARAFRVPPDDLRDAADWPWLYGDTYGSGPDEDPAKYLSVGGLRRKALEDWESGHFAEDWGEAPAPPTDLDLYLLAEQPAALDRSALEFCAADAFHPGIELTWPMRHLSIYLAPFRIARATQPEPDYGATLDVARACGADGPLHGQFAGSLSRWMLLPWQIDTGGCLAGYDDRLTYDAPSFWPSRVPNNVLTYGNYVRTVDPSLPADARRSAFAARRSWFFPLASPAQQWGERLIGRFGMMGVLEARPGLPGDADVPEVIYAETLPATPSLAEALEAAAAQAEIPAASEADRQAQAAGFADAADRQALRRMRFGR